MIGVNGKKAGIGLQPMTELKRSYSSLVQLPDYFRADLKLEQVVEGIAQIASLTLTGLRHWLPSAERLFCV